MCKEYGIKVIAEGIETEAELVTLIDLNVDYGQGYFIGYPNVDFKEIEHDKKLKIIEANNRKLEAKVQRIFGNIDEIMQQG